MQMPHHFRETTPNSLAVGNASFVMDWEARPQPKWRYNMSNGLRTTFWLHALVAIIFGLGYIFLPDFVTGLFNIELGDPFIAQLYGAATIALGVSSILAAMSRTFERVDIVLQMEVVYTLLAVLGGLYAIFFAQGSAMLWLGVAIFAIFLLAFGYYYLVTRSLTAEERSRPAMQ